MAGRIPGGFPWLNIGQLLLFKCQIRSSPAEVPCLNSSERSISNFARTFPPIHCWMTWKKLLQEDHCPWPLEIQAMDKVRQHIKRQWTLNTLHCELRSIVSFSWNAICIISVATKSGKPDNHSFELKWTWKMFWDTSLNKFRINSHGEGGLPYARADHRKTFRYSECNFWFSFLGFLLLLSGGLVMFVMSMIDAKCIGKLRCTFQ